MELDDGAATTTTNQEAETTAAAAVATDGPEKAAAEPAGTKTNTAEEMPKLTAKKKKRRVKVDIRTRPFPVLTEEQLAYFVDPVEREEWRELMARAAKHYYESREELAALGYN